MTAEHVKELQRKTSLGRRSSLSLEIGVSRQQVIAKKQSDTAAV